MAHPSTQPGYWEWREEILTHPDGRAVGGEPCVRCGQPVPANGHWKWRDRHVCSSRCNTSLARWFTRMLERGGGADLPALPSVPDPRTSEEPMWFATVPGDGTDPDYLPYQFCGFGPRVGDVVERDGAVTTYSYWPPEELPAGSREYLEHGVVACYAPHAARFLLVAADAERRATRLVHAHVGTDGLTYPREEPFLDDQGRVLRWDLEIIRDVAEHGPDLEWEAWVAVPAANPSHAGLWTPAFAARSAQRGRVSAATARHARRVRVEQATVERVDPQVVFDRDGWVCQLCRQPVDRDRRWPDVGSASLDHTVPLAAGGDHSYANTQLAHWICNVRKGARMEPLA